MDGKLMVPVPASVTAWYLVPSRLTADDARMIAMGRADEPSRNMIERADCGLKVEVSSTLTSGERFRRPEFVSDRGLVSFRASCRTGMAPVHEWSARELAAELAVELKVAAIADACAERWISVDEARASLHAKEDGNLRLSDWVRVAAFSTGTDHTRSIEPVSLETVGLRRYGLPELHVADVPSWFTDPWSVALTGLAERLRRDFIDAVYDATPVGELPLRTQAPPTFELPAEIMLSAQDVAAAYCLRGVMDPHGSVIGLGLDHDAAEAFLTVRPPDDGGWSPRDFLESVVEGPLKSVLKAARLFDDFVTGHADLEEFAVRF